MLPVDRLVDRWRRPVDRPVDRRARRAQDHHGRPLDRGRERSTGPVDRLTGLSSRLGPVDRRGRLTDAFSAAFSDSDSFSE